MSFACIGNFRYSIDIELLIDLVCGNADSDEGSALGQILNPASTYIGAC